MKRFLAKWSVPLILWGVLALAMIYLDRWMWIIVAVACGWFSTGWLRRYGSCRIPRNKRRQSG